MYRILSSCMSAAKTMEAPRVLWPSKVYKKLSVGKTCSLVVIVEAVLAVAASGVAIKLYMNMPVLRVTCIQKPHTFACQCEL